MMSQLVETITVSVHFLSFRLYCQLGAMSTFVSLKSTGCTLVNGSHRQLRRALHLSADGGRIRGLTNDSFAHRLRRGVQQHRRIGASTYHAGNFRKVAVSLSKFCPVLKNVLLRTTAPLRASFILVSDPGETISPHGNWTSLSPGETSDRQQRVSLWPLTDWGLSWT